VPLGACRAFDAGARSVQVRQMGTTRSGCIPEVRAQILWGADGVHGRFGAGGLMPYRLLGLGVYPLISNSVL